MKTSILILAVVYLTACSSEISTTPPAPTKKIQPPGEFDPKKKPDGKSSPNLPQVSFNGEGVAEPLGVKALKCEGDGSASIVMLLENFEAVAMEQTELLHLGPKATKENYVQTVIERLKGVAPKQAEYVAEFIKKAPQMITWFDRQTLLPDGVVLKPRTCELIQAVTFYATPNGRVFAVNKSVYEAMRPIDQAALLVSAANQSFFGAANLKAAGSRRFNKVFFQKTAPIYLNYLTAVEAISERYRVEFPLQGGDVLFFMLSREANYHTSDLAETFDKLGVRSVGAIPICGFGLKNGMTDITSCEAKADRNLVAVVSPDNSEVWRIGEVPKPYFRVRDLVAMPPIFLKTPQEVGLSDVVDYAWLLERPRAALAIKYKSDFTFRENDVQITCRKEEPVLFSSEATSLMVKFPSSQNVSECSSDKAIWSYGKYKVDVPTSKKPIGVDGKAVIGTSARPSSLSVGRYEIKIPEGITFAMKSGILRMNHNYGPQAQEIVAERGCRVHISELNLEKETVAGRLHLDQDCTLGLGTVQIKSRSARATVDSKTGAILEIEGGQTSMTFNKKTIHLVGVTFEDGQVARIRLNREEMNLSYFNYEVNRMLAYGENVVLGKDQKALYGHRPQELCFESKNNRFGGGGTSKCQ